MQEIEAKFFVLDLGKIMLRLQDLDAHLVQPRVLEMNLRFDLPDASLRSEGRVLRLRQDTAARLTYKGAGTNEQGALNRTEIEFEVEDFKKAKQFLEALGYQKLISYEKYRTTYELGDCHIMLDEMPYGDFVEIEGASSDSIRESASMLGLKWETAIATSYHALFDHLKRTLTLPFDDLTFDAFTGMDITPAQLGVSVADG